MEQMKWESYPALAGYCFAKTITTLKIALAGLELVRFLN